LIGAIERSGLRGRGGAAFPSGRKLQALAGRGRGNAVVVVNGTEGEPASAKDELLLTDTPHLVIDGAIAAAAAVGADRIVLCVSASRTRALSSLYQSLDERVAAEPPPVRIDVAVAPDGYVTGEERSLVSWLNGGAPVPNTGPRPYQRGVAGQPTLVHNVETVAQLAQIAAYGPDWFRTVGTPEEPGSALVTLSGATPRAGVYEVSFGTPLANLLSASGGSPGGISAVLVGGYYGTWISGQDAATARLSNQDLGRLGASLGAGVVAVLPADACGVAETARILRWFSSQSAGQCGPCVYGLSAIADASRHLVESGGDGTLTRLRRWADDVEGRGACRLPDGATRLLRSALDVFAADVDAHRRGRRCAASTRASQLAVPGVRAVAS
jgi:NADH:ubiquinone oxidoreductase subunit F (NADH-binding)